MRTHAAQSRMWEILMTQVLQSKYKVAGGDTTNIFLKAQLEENIEGKFLDWSQQ